MNRRSLLTVALFALLPLTAGCDDGPAPTELTVEQLDKLMQGKDKPAVFDANGARVRKEFGVIPGATLLSGSDYDVSATLPASKAAALVFYCSSTWCSAAKSSAKRAMVAGYSNVNVLPAGIKGWAGAGKKTQEI